MPLHSFCFHKWACHTDFGYSLHHPRMVSSPQIPHSVGTADDGLVVPMARSTIRDTVQNECTQWRKHVQNAVVSELPIRSCLQIVQVRVRAVTCHQLRMRSVLDNSGPNDYHNKIRHLDGGESV